MGDVAPATQSSERRSNILSRGEREWLSELGAKLLRTDGLVS